MIKTKIYRHPSTSKREAPSVSPTCIPAWKRFCYGVLLGFGNSVGHIPSHFVRNTVYRLLGLQLGIGSTLYGCVRLWSPHRIAIGRGTIIGDRAVLDGRGGLRIGDNVNLSSGVWIWTAQHDKNDPHFRTQLRPVSIEDYAWVSCRATILPGVRVGRGAVVCAGAVVTKNVEPYAIAAGVPASMIGKRSENLRYSLNEKIPFV